MKVLLTGYNGFLGSHLVKSIPHKMKLMGRTPCKGENFFKAEISADEDYEAPLKNIDCVIHLAARVHIMHEESENSLEAFRDINTHATLNLAKQAAKYGVKRFIFISTIKVNGESTQLFKPFTRFDPRNPGDPYGQSKSEAEEQLLILAKKTNMEVVIIRPPLVYGPGVKANFASLMKFVSNDIPLPFGAITANRRSLVSLNNLVDLIVTCIDHPNAANQIFLVSDDNDLSTAELIQYMAKGLGVSGRMIPVPVWCYRLAGKLFGKQNVVNRLIGSLQVDINHTKDTLGWRPPQSVSDAFFETAQAFKSNKEQSK